MKKKKNCAANKFTLFSFVRQPIECNMTFYCWRCWKIVITMELVVAMAVMIEMLNEFKHSTSFELVSEFSLKNYNRSCHEAKKIAGIKHLDDLFYDNRFSVANFVHVCVRVWEENINQRQVVLLRQLAHLFKVFRFKTIHLNFCFSPAPAIFIYQNIVLQLNQIWYLIRGYLCDRLFWNENCTEKHSKFRTYDVDSSKGTSLPSKNLIFLNKSKKMMKRLWQLRNSVGDIGARNCAESIKIASLRFLPLRIFDRNSLSYCLLSWNFLTRKRSECERENWWNSVNCELMMW